jgi:ABC-type antimicrobial peptide transport system permease subunit
MFKPFKPLPSTGGLLTRRLLHLDFNFKETVRSADSWDRIEERFMKRLSLFLVGVLTVSNMNSTASAQTPKRRVDLAEQISGAVLSAKQNEYVVAARSLGCTSRRILWRYLLPNVLAPILILSSLSLARAITAEASLSFLGLGVDPTLPTWGGKLRAGGRYFCLHPSLAVVPGLLVMLAVLGINAMGDAIRDILDPRMLSRVRGGRTR